MTMTSTICVCTSNSFSAHALYTGENRLIRVEGTCDCPTPNFAMSLSRDNPGIAPEPHRLKLLLSEVPPDDVQPQVISPSQADGIFEVGADVREVVIRRSGGSGFVLEVIEPR